MCLLEKYCAVYVYHLYSDYGHKVLSDTVSNFHLFVSFEVCLLDKYCAVYVYHLYSDHSHKVLSDTVSSFHLFVLWKCVF